jgi:hypothetical protein
MKKKHKTLNGAVAMSDKSYQEEEDARTLSRAYEIKQDKTRMKGAQRGAKRMVDVESARIQGLKIVARKKI